MRADLTYALTAALTHEGNRKGGVGLAVRAGMLRAYATDGYTAGLAQVPWPQVQPFDACLPAAEARDLMRFLRPSRVDEQTEAVEMLSQDGELHVAIPGDSQVFALQEPVYSEGAFLSLLGKLNTDAFNRDAKYALDWTVKNIKPSNREYLENLPVTVKTFGQVFTMVHASPRDPMWEYLLDLFDAAECFPLFSSRYCFVGHTHVPLVFRDMDGIVKAAIPESSETIELNVWPKLMERDVAGG